MAPFDLASQPEYSEVPETQRTQYWIKFAIGEHRRELGFLLKIAKLGRKPHQKDGQWFGWNNVMKHNVTQAAAIRTLCKALGYDKDEPHRTRAEAMEAYAFIHNPAIHLDKQAEKEEAGVDTKNFPKSERFTEIEQWTFEICSDALHEEVDFDSYFRIATSPSLFSEIAKANYLGSIIDNLKHMPFDQLLVYYIDALFDDSTLMAAHDRIERMEKRRPDLNADEDLTEDLGMRYWDAERAVSTKIQEMVWERLKKNDIELASHEDVPEFIRKQIAQEMLGNA
tara:strand:- start:308 stop:1153 length:846 start_codon:yes stop_codon:yes gene_type:complete